MQHPNGASRDPEALSARLSEKDASLASLQASLGKRVFTANPWKNPPSILEAFCWPWFFGLQKPVNIDTFDT